MRPSAKLCLRPDLAKYLGEARRTGNKELFGQAKFTSELGALFGGWLMDPVFSVRPGSALLREKDCKRLANF